MVTLENERGEEDMFRTIYQQLLILGFSEKMIILTILFISFFLIFIFIRPVVSYLIKKKCYTLLSYVFTFLIIFLITKEWSKDLVVTLDFKLYLYLFSIVAGILAIQLLYKKIVRKTI